MTTQEKRIYSRAYALGYQAGLRRAWPAWAPPTPPHEQVAALFKAASDLHQAACGVLSVMVVDDGPDGPFTLLQEEANAVDAAFTNIEKWLKDGPK